MKIGLFCLNITGIRRITDRNPPSNWAEFMVNPNHIENQLNFQGIPAGSGGIEKVNRFAWCVFNLHPVNVFAEVILKLKNQH